VLPFHALSTASEVTALTRKKIALSELVGA
jgi:hypothetical protein